MKLRHIQRKRETVTQLKLRQIQRDRQTDRQRQTDRDRERERLSRS